MQKEKEWPCINTHASFTGTLVHENAAYIRWDIFVDNNPATNSLRMLMHTQASLGHLTLDEASRQAANVRWDILKDIDPATHCMYQNTQQKSKFTPCTHRGFTGSPDIR